MATTDKKKRPESSTPGSDSEYDPLLRSKSRPSNRDGGSVSKFLDIYSAPDPDCKIKNSLRPDSEIINLLKMLDAAETSHSRDPNPNPIPLPPRRRRHRSSPYDEEHIDGVFVGSVVLSYCGEPVDFTKMGLSGTHIPPNVDNVSDLTSNALFILLIENETAFMRLANARFYDRIPCIMISSQGYLDVGTRLFLKKMKTELNLPVLALVDPNPLGLQILSVYMCGSKDDSSNLSIPDIKWLGFRPSDLDNYKIPEGYRITMTKKDIKTVRDLLKEDFVKKNPYWVKELKLMVKSKEKAHMEALSFLGHRSQYLSELYLPHKLQEKDWL